MSSEMIDDVLARYYDTRLKFNYFILTTTLAILGLSIQIITPKQSDLYPSLIFSAWGILLFSFLAGIIWQTSWIGYYEYVHSALLDKHFKNKYPTINKSLIYRLTLSWVIQISLFILGILFIAVYKVINFYYGSPVLQ